MDRAGTHPEHLQQQALLCTAVERIGRDWVATVVAMQRLDAGFAAKLAACADAVAASAVCAEWLGHRLDSAVVAQHRMLEAWLEGPCDERGSDARGTEKQ